MRRSGLGCRKAPCKGIGAESWRMSGRAGREERRRGSRRQGFVGNQELRKEFWILFQDSCFLKKTKKKGFKSPCSPQPPPPHAQIFMSKIRLQRMLGRWEGGQAKRKAVRSPHRGPAAGCVGAGGLHRGVGHGSESWELSQDLLGPELKDLSH
uniref:Uncharacterized protein n=1 Tax=Myotis myotis TaxID=51298 RepID=A0A7J7SCX9_MYOMY|nr:hypothetical protein mMyoMyo1_009557 [Myotis myotis]